MSVIIRLQNLPWSVDAQGIRQFFHGLSIPDGGVHIIGGENGDAFITFSTDEDARRAMMKDGNLIENVPIRLFLSSRTELCDVAIATYGTLLPLLGSSVAGQFSHPAEHGTHGSGLTGQISPTIAGNLFLPPVIGKDWPQGIACPLGVSVPEPKRVTDIGLRLPSNRLVFSKRQSSDAVIGSSSMEDSLQIFSIEHGQLSGNKSGSLERPDRQKSAEKRGNSSSGLHEESAVKVMKLQNPEGQDGLDKASLLREFAKINDNLYRCMKKLSEHSDAGRPALGQDFLTTHAGSEFTSIEDGGHEFRHPELGKECLARDISCVSHEELFRSLYDARVSREYENKSRIIKGLFTGDVSHMAPSGARDSRAAGNNKDPRLLRPTIVSQSDLNTGFPGLGLIHSVLGQGLGLGLLNENHGFGAGQREKRLPGEFPTLGLNERQSQIGRNSRDEKLSLGLLNTTGNYSEIARELLCQLADVIYDANGRQPCKISRKDVFSPRGTCGFWICASNFPPSYSHQEFCDFFSGRGIPATGFKLVTDSFGKLTGLAYVKFNSHQATVESLKLDGRVVDGYRVAVERCSEAEYEGAVDNHKPLICVDQVRSRSRSPIDAQRILPNEEKVCVVVKNLSSRTTVEDIREYFGDSIIADNGGPFMEFDFEGLPKHMALVQFDSVGDIRAAFSTYSICPLLNGAAVKMVAIKMGEFFDRLQRSRISRFKKHVALRKQTATMKPAKLKTKK